MNVCLDRIESGPFLSEHRWPDLLRHCCDFDQAYAVFPCNAIVGTELSGVLLGSFNPGSISGGSGNDFTTAGESLDIVFGGADSDVVLGCGGSDERYGDAGNDVVSGGSGSDTIHGDNFGSSGVKTEPVTTAASIIIAETGQGFAINLTAPDGSDGDTSTISGFVCTTAVTNQQVNVSIVIDVSGSSIFSFLTGGTPVADINGDGISDTILDAGITATIAFFNSVINDAQFTGANIQIVEFGSAASTVFTGTANADTNSDLVLDAVRVLLGLQGDGPFSGSTSFEAPLQQSISFFRSAPAGQNFVYFLSDGFPVTSGAFTDELATLIDPAGINAKITAIGLGNDASLTSLELLDDGQSNGSAERVLDPAELNAALLDGVLIRAFLPSELVPTPFGLRFDLNLTGLSASAAEDITVIAVATDNAAAVISTSQIVEAVGAIDNATLFGDDGSDLMFGGGGDDVIDGGAGNDTMNCGTGTGVFFFAAGTGNGIDRVNRFENTLDAVRIELGGMSQETVPVSLVSSDTRFTCGPSQANLILLARVQLTFGDILFDFV